jgi:hypothetical protein
VYFDLMGTLTKFLPSRPADFILAVHDHREGARVSTRTRFHAFDRSHVTVTARLAERLARVENPRAGNQSKFNGTRQSIVGPRSVANRGEPPEQGLLKVSRAVMREQRNGQVVEL